MPEVSVIVPNYNYARFLPQRMESILGQTFQDFELIILDDASTDNSKDVLETYRNHPKVAFIEYNAVNSGTPFAQWNKGVAHASGEFVWIAETDDSCESALLEKAVAQLKKHPSAGIAYVQSLEWDEISSTKYISFADHPRFSGSFLNSYFNSGPKEVAEKLIFENTIPNASAVVFRRSVYEKCGRAEETMKLVGDWMMWTKMLLISDVCFIAEPLNFFRVTPFSARIKHPWKSTLAERLRVLNLIEAELSVPSAVEEAQVRLLRRAFNSFPLGHTLSALKLIHRSKGSMSGSGRKMWKAFFLSLKVRLRNLINQKQS